MGLSEILSCILEDLKDDLEPYQSMVMETVTRVLENLRSGDTEQRLEEQLIDGLMRMVFFGLGNGFIQVF